MITYFLTYTEDIRMITLLQEGFFLFFLKALMALHLSINLKLLYINTNL